MVDHYIWDVGVAGSSPVTSMRQVYLGICVVSVD